MLIERMKYAGTRFFKEGYYDHAAQTAYYFMLSLFPFLIMVVSSTSFLPFSSSDLIAVIRPYAPPETYGLIETNLTTILDSGQGTVISISFLSTMWLASMAIQSLVRSLTDIYKIKRRESYIKGLFSDFFLTIGFALILPLTILIPIIENVVQRIAEETFLFDAEWLVIWTPLRWGIGTIILFVFFWVLYRHLPKHGLSWKDVLPGAVFAVISWQLISEGFSLFVGYGNYSQLYGQLASVVVMMIWFYLTAAVLLFGALLNVHGKEGKERGSE
ncbi:YihY/virulence factor BrkB family protein [Jeotgalibacillus salarius]|uniref:YihY/virulence factor BrkB family protein n=1 Tax=Jeotgalibacillus salarius TaxID=546023 RepID=A0A4Y8LA52_9BACL|nr:YihY/virulence factor BrkB family protein [Jeotgalibacillus salarius]TFD99247.1 YihY/virulence factor BrkB family protein [Jeotgalibacillus salarius]